ncbi:hypothetical protein RJC98_06610 [Pseudomonas allii]|uniref:Uncharacterized protein n=2 Tax=Pseudomonas allii TaxID=2740531 RepID=A0ACC6L8P3_9PSED|nr:hypothetical protein [Pseudomonas allii]MDR9874842.1 hypothetical protein [Pseudomonas allii]NWN46230.1 hypothetical protein [Pseudomonas allii]NWN61460.1 hypothetical protein [Pseudomonas allii]
MPASVEYYRTLPTPHDILNLTPPETATLLKALNKNVIYTLGHLPTRPVSALKLLTQVLKHYLPEPELDRIFYSCPPMDATPQQTLYELYHHLVLFNALPSTYDASSVVFYTPGADALQALPPECQARLKIVLQNLQGIEFYLSDLADFWQARHAYANMTNQAYVARAFAAQLQCAASLRLADGSLDHESVALITLLASPGHISGCHLYRIAFQDEEQQAHVPLYGAFLISRTPANAAPGQNPCVLYVPGLKLQAFYSPALLRAHLIAELNETTLHRLLPCIDRNQLQRLEELARRGLRDDHVSLSPMVFSPHFYEDVSLALINQQRRDIRHAWAWAQPRHFQEANWINRHIEAASDLRSLMTLESTFKDHATPAIAAFERKLPPRPAPIPAPAAPKPINLNVYIHRDLHGDSRLPSLRDDYFSWLKTELEDLSGRTVMITFHQETGPAYLIDFNYKRDHRVSLSTWKNTVLQHLEHASIAPSPLDLYLLLTLDDIDSQTAGVAYLHDSFGIAATTSYRTAAHEVGHMLGALHEDGDNIFNGWWHETLMKDRDFFSFLRGNAYRFSDKNRDNIRTYLSQFG